MVPESGDRHSAYGELLDRPGGKGFVGQIHIDVLEGDVAQDVAVVPTRITGLANTPSGRNGSSTR